MYGHHPMAVGLLASSSALPFALHGTFLLPAMSAVLVTMFIGMAAVKSIHRRRSIVPRSRGPVAGEFS
jgi:hypothetical protein